MSKFNQLHNIDNNFFRNLIVSILNLLNDKIKITQVLNHELIEEISVPFFYDSAGDERFWQDLLLQQSRQDCIDIKIVEGNVDVLPRGHLTVSSIGINTSALTNKFTPGEYVKEENGELLTYHAPIQQVPLNINFNIEIRTRGRLMLFKLIQKIIETFYKAHTVKFMFNGIIVKARIGFPDDQNFEEVNQFTFSDPTMEKFTIAIETNSFLPVINYTQAILKSNRIEQFGINSHLLPEDAYTIEQKNLYGYMIDSFQSHYSKIQSKSLLNNTYQQGSGLSVEAIKNYSVQNFFDRANYNNSAYGTLINLNQDLNTTVTENIDNNIHQVDQFGVPTETLNDVLSVKTNQPPTNLNI